MNTLENNKLIAEFMGIESYKFRHYTMFAFEEDNHRTAQDLHYHQSWDWLMPVVEKIELTYMYSVTICWEHCIIDKAGENKEGFPRIELDSSHKILATYNAVVEFIKWYNENNL